MCAPRQASLTVAFLICASLALSGCENAQSALNPQGPQARTLADLFWIFLAVLTAVWLLANGAMAFALMRQRAGQRDPLALDLQKERRMMQMVAAAAAATLLIVLALTGLSYGGQKTLATKSPGALAIRVTGHQWWWDVVYENDDPLQTFRTANELRVPVGEPILINLESEDVIHSFWVPSLAGKLDLIPGRRNVLQIRADAPGVYRGQCAEFCGLQHAYMGVVVVALARDEFDAWRASQIAAAEEPKEEERKRGKEIFLAAPCVMCHQVRGTPAGGRTGPDLTHVGGRTSIAAGAMKNTRGNLAAWIVDPQGVKPGSHMPNVPLQPDEIEPLALYLEGLK